MPPRQNKRLLRNPNVPKPARNIEEVEAVRQQIMETARKLMCEDGFAALSMRKLANRLGMTAPNIYNYFTNKDELYLTIQTTGFQMLYDRFAEIYGSDAGPTEKLKGLMRAYIQFGFDFPDFYEIMFSRNTPKYADYKGTPMEPAASIEKQAALNVADLTEQAIQELMPHVAAQRPGNARYLTILLWSALHGAVNLYNSRVLQEVDAAAGALIDRMTDDLINRFFT
jgi:AcrR family transcriptional regulator